MSEKTENTDENNHSNKKTIDKVKKGIFTTARFGFNTFKWLSLYPLYKHFISTTFSVFKPVGKTAKRDIDFMKKGFSFGSPLKSFNQKIKSVKKNVVEFPDEHKKTIKKKGLTSFLLSREMEWRSTTQLRKMFKGYRNFAILHSVGAMAFLFMFWVSSYDFMSGLLMLLLVLALAFRSFLYIIFGLKTHELLKTRGSQG